MDSRMDVRLWIENTPPDIRAYSFEAGGVKPYGSVVVKCGDMEVGFVGDPDKVREMLRVMLAVFNFNVPQTVENTETVEIPE